MTLAQVLKMQEIEAAGKELLATWSDQAREAAKEARLSSFK